MLNTDLTHIKTIVLLTSRDHTPEHSAIKVKKEVLLKSSYQVKDAIELFSLVVLFIKLCKVVLSVSLCTRSLNLNYRKVFRVYGVVLPFGLDEIPKCDYSDESY